MYAERLPLRADQDTDGTSGDAVSNSVACFDISGLSTYSRAVALSFLTLSSIVAAVLQVQCRCVCR